MPFEIRQTMFEKYEYKCANCGSEVVLFQRFRGDWKVGEVDHIMPFSKGGGNEIENLQLLCVRCNRSKYNAIPEG